MIPPGEAAELLARWAAPATDPGKAHAAIETIRSLCGTAADAGTQFTPGVTLDILDGLRNPSSAAPSPARGSRPPGRWETPSP